MICRAAARRWFASSVERGAGVPSSFSDADYERAGATLANDAIELLRDVDIIAKVRPPTDDELGGLRPDVILIALLNPLAEPDLMRRLADAKVSALAMELCRESRGPKKWTPSAP